jgi:hypothetical protein
MRSVPEPRSLRRRRKGDARCPCLRLSCGGSDVLLRAGTFRRSSIVRWPAASPLHQRERERRIRGTSSFAGPAGCCATTMERPVQASRHAISFRSQHRSRRRQGTPPSAPMAAAVLRTRFQVDTDDRYPKHALAARNANLAGACRHTPAARCRHDSDAIRFRPNPSPKAEAHTIRSSRLFLRS